MQGQKIPLRHLRSPPGHPSVLEQQRARYSVRPAERHACSWHLCAQAERVFDAWDGSCTRLDCPPNEAWPSERQRPAGCHSARTWRQGAGRGRACFWPRGGTERCALAPRSEKYPLPRGIFNTPWPDQPQQVEVFRARQAAAPSWQRAVVAAAAARRRDAPARVTACSCMC